MLPSSLCVPENRAFWRRAYRQKRKDATAESLASGQCFDLAALDTIDAKRQALILS
jgi:hypothetical protein